MSEYTPSTEEVRIAYNHWGKYPEFAPDDFDVTEAEFDRWLASERARIWDESSKSIQGELRKTWPRYRFPATVARRVPNPYRKSGDDE